MSKQKRCKCLGCKGMGEVISSTTYILDNDTRCKIPIDNFVKCQDCLGSGWLYEKDFMEQIKHYSNVNNLEVIEAYEHSSDKEIPML